MKPWFRNDFVIFPGVLIPQTQGEGWSNNWWEKPCRSSGARREVQGKKCVQRNHNNRSNNNNNNNNSNSKNNNNINNNNLCNVVSNHNLFNWYNWCNNVKWWRSPKSGHEFGAHRLHPQRCAAATELRAPVANDAWHLEKVAENSLK